MCRIFHAKVLFFVVKSTTVVTQFYSVFCPVVMRFNWYSMKHIFGYGSDK